MSPTTLLAGKLNIGVAHAVMSSKGISAAKRLLISAQVAANLLLACVVNRVFVPGKVVGSREDSVAGLSSAGVDTIAAVRPSLRHETGRHATWLPATVEAMCLAMSLPLVLLQKRWGFEAHSAAMVCAGVRASISRDIRRSLWWTVDRVQTGIDRADS